jgi:hypothetical protein
VVSDAVEIPGMAAPPSGKRREAEVLVEEMGSEAGEEGDKAGAFEQAGAEGVGDGDLTGAGCFDEAGDAEEGIAAEFEGVAEGVGEAAPENVDRPEAVEGLQEHPAIADGQVGALDQGEAEEAGEVGLFEVGGVTGAGGEEGDGGVVGGCGSEAAEGVEAKAEGVDEGPGAEGLGQFGEDAREDTAVLEGEAEAGRGLGTVSKDDPASVGAAGDVGGVGLEVTAAGDANGLAGAPVAGVGEDEGRGDEAVADEALDAEEVGEDEVEEAGALDEAGLEIRPFVGGDEVWDKIQVPGGFGGAGGGVGADADAVFAQDAAAVGGTEGEFVGAEPVEAGGEGGLGARLPGVGCEGDEPDSGGGRGRRV